MKISTASVIEQQRNVAFFDEDGHRKSSGTTTCRLKIVVSFSLPYSDCTATGEDINREHSDAKMFPVYLSRNAVPEPHVRLALPEGNAQYGLT